MVPVSILYTLQAHLWLMLDSNLVNITDLMLSRLIYLTLTASKPLSSSGSPTCRSSSWQMMCIIFLPHWSWCCWCIYLHITLKWFSSQYPLIPYHMEDTFWEGPCCSISCLTMSKSFVSFISLRAHLCTLWTSTLHTHSNACSLVVSSNSATNLRISLTIPSSLRPLMNCSVLSLPIHSCADSLFFVQFVEL